MRWDFVRRGAGGTEIRRCSAAACELYLLCNRRGRGGGAERELAQEGKKIDCVKAAGKL